MGIAIGLALWLCLKACLYSQSNGNHLSVSPLTYWADDRVRFCAVDHISSAKLFNLFKVHLICLKVKLHV